MRVEVQPYMWASIGVVVLVAVIAGLARAAHSSDKQLTGSACTTVTHFIDSAVRSACQAEQDGQPIQQLSDAQFGLAYVNCSRLLAGSDELLEGVTNTRIGELHAALKTQQREALQKIAKACPSLSMTRTYAVGS